MYSVRWLSRDPIGVAGGLNLYSYVGNNPISNVDPLGLQLSTHGEGPVGPHLRDIVDRDNDLGQIYSILGASAAAAVATAKLKAFAEYAALSSSLALAKSKVLEAIMKLRPPPNPDGVVGKPLVQAQNQAIAVLLRAAGATNVRFGSKSCGQPGELRVEGILGVSKPDVAGQLPNGQWIFVNTVSVTKSGELTTDEQTRLGNLLKNAQTSEYRGAIILTVPKL